MVIGICGINKGIIGIDPSGVFTAKFRGTTGIAYYDPIKKDINVVSVSAKLFKTKDEYYTAIKDTVIRIVKNLYSESKVLRNNVGIAIENFTLQKGKASVFANRELSTSELIADLEAFFKINDIMSVRQQNTIKHRWPIGLIREELKRYGITLSKIPNTHCGDAVRHLMHYMYFNKGDKNV